MNYLIRYNPIQIITSINIIVPTLSSLNNFENSNIKRTIIAITQQTPKIIPLLNGIKKDRTIIKSNT